MDMLATLRRSGGIEALARQLGETPANATAQVIELLPSLLDDFRSYANNLNGLLEILDNFGGGEMAAAVMAREPADDQAGRGLLDIVLHGTGGPAAGVGTGFDPAMLTRMRPLLAMLIGGYIAARAGAGTLDQPAFVTMMQPISVGDSGNVEDDEI